MAALAERAGDDLDLAGLFPTTQLADHLLPPLKREGVPFEDAWELALERVVWPSSLREAKEWRQQLAATRVGWQAAYENWPPERQEAAIAALSDGLDDLEFLDDAA
jgi:hypothetical protein